MSALATARRVRQLASMLSGVTRVHLLRAGLALGLFEALREPKREALLAESLGFDPELTASWLQAAEAHGLVHRTHHPADAYRIDPFVAWLIDSPDAGALRAMVDQSIESYAPLFQQLPEIFRGGERPRFEGDAETRRVAEISRLIEPRALAALHRVPGVKRARMVLDIGCGLGGYLIGLLRRYRDARGVGIELDADVAEQARRLLREGGVSRRAEIEVGDFMSLELPPGAFDLALMNNNLYYFPPDRHRALFARVRSKLDAEATLAIQLPMPTRSWIARAAGIAPGTAAFDLFLRGHENLYGLPEPAALHALLRDAGFASTGETPIIPGGAARYVWARV